MAKVTLDMETFKALASTTRLQVLRCLDERRKTLSELSKELELNKATVHEHLAILVTTGLVKKRDDEGRKWIYYELTWQGERLLHPQETTTFAVLLGFSVAAAGGGVALLGRAMQWWWADKQMSSADSFETAPYDAGLRAAEDGAEESGDAPPSGPSEPGGEPSGEPSGEPGSEPSPSASPAAPESAGQDAATAAPAPPEDSAMEDQGGSVFDIDPDGVLSILFIITAILLAVLAFAMRRGRRS